MFLKFAYKNKGAMCTEVYPMAAPLDLLPKSPPWWKKVEQRHSFVSWQIVTACSEWVIASLGKLFYTVLGTHEDWKAFVCTCGI